MAERSVVEILLKARGGRAVASETGAATTALNKLGYASNVTSKSMRRLSDVTRGATYAIGTYGLYRALKATAGAGLEFNATMEQNTVAFEQFLGSTQAAREELNTLYGIAKKTPFEFPELTMAARRLIAVGFAAKDANSLLTTIGDTVSGIGGGADAIDRMVTALGQIRSKGRLQTEELMQLQELGAVDTNDLRKRLGLTRDEMANLGNQGVSANRAIKALKAQWDDTFGGASAKQAKTFAGQISTLHDNFNQLAGTATKPLFNDLRNNVLPVANEIATELNSVFSEKDLSLGEKFDKAGQILRREGGPIVDDFIAGIKAAHLDDRLGEAIGWAGPKIAQGAADVAPVAAKAFVHAWLHSGPWAQLASGIYVASKVGKAAGAGGMFGVRGPIAAGSGANPIAVVAVNGGLGGGLPGVGGKGKGGKLLGIAGKGVLAVTGYELAHSEAMKHPGLSQYSGSKGFGELFRDITDDLRGDPDYSERKNRTMLPVHEIERLANYPDSHARVMSGSRMQVQVTHTPVTMDGRKVGEAVSRVTVRQGVRDHK